MALIHVVHVATWCMCVTVFGTGCFHWKNTTTPSNAECVSVCVTVSVLAHMRLFLLNTCVTLGTVQLKSNTLQESITCWVYRQWTELKWPTEKGRGGLFEEHGSKTVENIITEVALPANANILQMHWQAASVKTAVSSASQIFKGYIDDTDWNPSVGNQAVRYQKQWNMDGMMRWH